MSGRRFGIPIFKQVTVPGGSKWKCSKCGRPLQVGEKTAKGGSTIFCSECVQSARR